MLRSIAEPALAPSQPALSRTDLSSASILRARHPHPSQSPTPSPSASGTSTPSTTSSTSSGGSRTQRAPPLTDEQLVEVRAAQRTFEGAYIRTALGQFGFALVVLRIFTAEFYSIGALFAVYGAGVLLIALYRRHQGSAQFFLEEVVVVEGEGVGGGEGVGEQAEVVSRFRTSGNVVCVMTALSLMAYCTLLVLILRLGR